MLTRMMLQNAAAGCLIVAVGLLIPDFVHYGQRFWRFVRDKKKTPKG